MRSDACPETPLPWRLLMILATRLDSANELEGVSCADSSAAGSVPDRAFQNVQ